MKKLLIVLLLLLVGTSLMLAQEADTITVDAGATQGEISPYILGANYGAYSTLNPDQFEAAKTSGVSFLRLPGGAAFDEDGRDVTPFLVDQMILVTRMIGAEPSIQAKLFDTTPEIAAELVRYTNIKKQYGVKYWYIGNEPNLYPNDYNVDDLNREWRAIAEAMLAVDPDIILIGPDLSQYPGIADQNPKDVNGKDWMDEFLKVNGDLVDVVSVHRYPFPQGGRVTTVDDLRNNTQEWDVIIPFLRERIKTITGEDKPIAIGEINSHWNNVLGTDATADSHFHGIWIGDILGRMMRQQIFMASYFEFYGGPDRAFGLIDRYKVRPAYYTYQLYDKFGSELVTADSQDPLVTAYAALREDGALTVMVINMGDDEATKTLELANFTPSGAAEIWRYDPEHNAELIETTEIASGAALTLPGQSITLYVIPG